MNYRDEMQHDLLLMGLTEELDRVGRLDLMSETLGIPFPGGLERAQRRKPFDVELTFTDCSCIIESKVDSDESGGWGEPYQTETIAESARRMNYLKDKKVFLFVTYGTSEYYTKPYKNGPASPDFRHTRLEDMIRFVERALEQVVSNRGRYEEWLSLMRIEQRKRACHSALLKAFGRFRREYLAIHGDIDFPNNRFAFCAPELAFPFLYGLAEYWNSRPSFSGQFGRVSVYPVARMSPPIHDSILNFWEMWDSGQPAIGKTLAGDTGTFYFEINEDFNLNLKFDSETLPDSIRDLVWEKLIGMDWGDGVYGRRRQYKQAIFVLFEWDFGLLENPDDYPVAAERLLRILQNATKALG